MNNVGSLITSSKLLLTDNNYQSYQSFTNKKNQIENYWTKIGNYCQFSIGDAFNFEFIKLTLNTI